MTKGKYGQDAKSRAETKRHKKSIKKKNAELCSYTKKKEKQ